MLRGNAFLLSASSSPSTLQPAWVSIMHHQCSRGAMGGRGCDKAPKSRPPLRMCSSDLCQPLAPPGSTLPVLLGTAFFRAPWSQSQRPWETLGQGTIQTSLSRDWSGGCRSRPCSDISELSVQDEMSLPGHVFALHLGLRATRGLSNCSQYWCQTITVLRQGLPCLHVL